MALTDLTRISTSGIATGTSLSGAILHGDAHFRGTQVGVNSAIFDSSDDALEFNDNVKLTFGNGGDLKLYHTGSHSYIQDSGDGDLVLLSNQVAIRNAAENEDLARFIENTGVQLYDGANTVRLATNDNGVVVTGILTATGFSGPLSNTSGISTFYDLRVSNNLTVEGTTTTLDTNLIGVDRVEVGANSNTVTGIAVTQSGSADILNLFNATGEQVTVLSSGNVGIGSAVPELDLDVARASSGDNVVKVQNRGSALSLIKYVNVNNSDVRAGSDYGHFAVYTGGDSGSRKLKVEHGGDVKIENGGLTVTGEVTVNSTANQPLVLNNTNANGQSSISFQSAGSTKYNLGSNKDADGNIDFFIFDQVNGKHRFNINASGSVGIGTDTPSAFLHLHKTSGNALIKLENTNGTSYLDIRHTNGYGAVHYTHQGTEKWRVGQTAQADHFSVYQSSSVSDGLPYRLFIQNNGEVGINTSDPTNTLHLLRNNANHGITLQRAGTNAGTAVIQVSSFGALKLEAANNLNLNSGGSQQIFFNRGSTEVARFDTSGRLGIGTDSPSKALHVDGTIFASGATTSLDGGLRIQPNNDGTNYGGVIYGGAHNDNNTAIYMRRGADGGNNTIDINSYGMFRVFTDGALASQDERLRIGSNGSMYLGYNSSDGLPVQDGSIPGNLRLFSIHGTGTSLGIKLTNSTTGTTTGDGVDIRLHGQTAMINQNEAYDLQLQSKGELAFRTGSTPAERLRITSAGQTKLNISSNSALTEPLVIRNGGTGAGTNVGMVFYNGNESNSGAGALAKIKALDVGNYDSDLAFETGLKSGWSDGGTIERLRITHDGNVGIGTNNPADILDINSDSASAVTNMYLRNHANLGGAALNLFTQGTYASPTYKAIIGCSDAGGNIRMGAHSNHDLLLLTNNAPRVTVKTGGDVEIADGNLIVASGHGIDFSATANSAESGSTMSSELLDDYEEGTATFALHIAGGEASGVSYSYNTAPYVKVGRIVYCAISMFATSVPADTGVIDIVGLPFQDGGGGGYREPAFLAGNHGGVSPAGTVITGAMHGSGTKIRIRKNGNQDLDGGDIGGTFWMHGHITYMST